MEVAVTLITPTMFAPAVVAGQPAIFCGCGAQWHGRSTTSIAIGAHMERARTNAGGCRPLTHAQFRQQFKCGCDDCAAARCRRWQLERQRRRRQR
jgi:hypothetical protein